MFLVARVVGGDFKQAARHHACGEKVQEAAVYQLALVVRGFVPRVGKVEIEAGEAGGRHPTPQRESRIAMHDAYVGQPQVVRFALRFFDGGE